MSIFTSSGSKKDDARYRKEVGEYQVPLSFV